jgi:hypothetical protein
MTSITAWQYGRTSNQSEIWLDGTLLKTMMGGPFTLAAMPVPLASENHRTAARTEHHSNQRERSPISRTISFAKARGSRQYAVGAPAHVLLAIRAERAPSFVLGRRRPGAYSPNRLRDWGPLV